MQGIADKCSVHLCHKILLTTLKEQAQLALEQTVTVNLRQFEPKRGSGWSNSLKKSVENLGLSNAISEAKEGFFSKNNTTVASATSKLTRTLDSRSTQSFLHERSDHY